jgi:hypothetical protein
MYAVSTIITAIAGSLTTKKQVNEVSNIFYGKA